MDHQDWYTSAFDRDVFHFKSYFRPPRSQSYPGPLNFGMFEGGNQTTTSLYDVVIVPLVLFQSLLASLTSSPKNNIVLTIKARKYMFKRERYAPEDLQSWKHVEENVQQQEDGHSCGVFILMFAEAILGDIPLLLMRQSHTRRFRQYLKGRLLSSASDVKDNVCAVPFCHKPSNDSWAQCRDCLLWSHCKCSGMKKQGKEQLCILCKWREETEESCH